MGVVLDAVTGGFLPQLLQVASMSIMAYHARRKASRAFGPEEKLQFFLLSPVEASIELGKRLF